MQPPCSRCGETEPGRTRTAIVGPMGLRRSALLSVAFVSGAAALIYQAVWLRWFQVLFGSSVYAASATLCAFFAGLALGSELFGRVAARARRPLWVYGWLELGAAAFALAVPWVFELYDSLYPGLYGSLSEHRAAFVAVKFGLALIVMLPPSLLLGGTFPLLAAAYVDDSKRLGSAGGRLYAINTLGAAAGSAAGLLWLPEWIGVTATYAAGMGLALVAAAAAFGLARGSPTGAPRAQTTGAGDSRAALPLRAIAFASGFGTLALEVLLIHAIAQLLDHSVYSYGAVLVVVLLSLAVGAAVVSATEGLISAQRLLVLALIAEAVLLLLLPAEISSWTDHLGSGRGALSRGFAAAVCLGGPVLLVGGLVLPLTFRLAAGGPVGRRVGGLLAANTAGGILGSLSASFVLLESLGLWISIATIGLGYGLASLTLGGSLRQRALRAGLAAVAVAAVVGGPLSPWALPRVALGKGERLVAYREGAYGVVSVIDTPPYRFMKINVVFVGSATGHTAGAAVLHPVEEIVLVEIVPEVQAMAAEYFARTNRGVHRDPRTRLVVEDGRNHLRATQERYDVIVADLFLPWRPGVGSLYTREHFEAVRQRLAPGGLFCQWLPIHQHGQESFQTLAATFLDVFPNATVWRGDFYRKWPRVALIGFEGEPAPVASVDARVRELAARGVEDRWVTLPWGFWMLYVGPLAAASELAAVPLNSDARPRFEYLAGRIRVADSRAFTAHAWPAFAARLLARAGSDSPYAAALRYAADGAAMARLNALSLAGRDEEFARELRRLRARLPAELLRTPDPTVAEMWSR